MKPLISVIVPIYNTSEYLEQCLESILSQSLKEIEIICIDDGSTDSSLEILVRKKLQDSRIRILQQENKGGGAARNLGLREATGKYLSFLDSDDFFDSEMLECVYLTAEKYDADVTVFRYHEFNDKTSHISNKEYGFPNTLLDIISPASHTDILQFIFTIPHAPWNKLYRNDFIKKHNFKFQEIKKSNDLYFGFTTLYFAEKIAFLNKSLLFYRTGIETSTVSTTYEAPCDVYHALLEVCNRLSNTPSWHMTEKGFVNEALNLCIGQLEKLRNLYPDAFDEIRILLNAEGYDKLGISKYSKSDFENKWNYWKYQQYRSWKNVEEMSIVEKNVKKLRWSICLFLLQIVALINLLKSEGVCESVKRVMVFLFKKEKPTTTVNR